MVKHQRLDYDIYRGFTKIVNLEKSNQLGKSSDILTNKNTEGLREL